VDQEDGGGGDAGTYADDEHDRRNRTEHRSGATDSKASHKRSYLTYT
jgi:hypothetical protein